MKKLFISILNRIFVLFLLFFVLSVLVNAESALAQTIDANPTTVSVNAGEQGSSTITWAIDDADLNGTVYYTTNGANETFFSSGLTGTKVADFIEAGNTYVFTLWNQNKTVNLASVTVTGKLKKVLIPGGHIPTTIKSFYENIVATGEGTYLDIKFDTLRSCLSVVRVS
ncbi:MAG: hypothetical protein ACR2NW_02155, partial [Thermodesulfobacteriota bacterium]